MNMNKPIKQTKTNADWEKFVKHSPEFIEQVVGREECGFPDWFVPEARGGAIASKKLFCGLTDFHGDRDYLWQPSCRVPLVPTARIDRPSEEMPIQRRVFDCSLLYRESVMVRQLQNKLWTVEWYGAQFEFSYIDLVLVHKYGSTPILTRTRRQAENLAVHFFLVHCPRDDVLASRPLQPI
jgi:hypothetical protein